MKRLSVIFVVAFLLNIVWENLHSLLYASYQGTAITEFILIRASLFDALLITLLAASFLYVSFFRKREWFILIIGIVIAVINEWYGLGTSRWAYNSLMPIIPFIHTGLTPTLQLGLLGFIAYKIEQYSFKKFLL